MIEFLQSILQSLQQGIAAIIGIVVSLCIFMITLRRNRILARNQHTFAALLQMSFNDRYQDSLCLVRPYFAQGLPADVAESKHHQQLRDAVFLLFNYHEFLAVAVEQSVISEELLKADQEYIMNSTFRISRTFIGRIREEQRRPALLESSERLYKKWTDRDRE